MKVIPAGQSVDAEQSQVPEGNALLPFAAAVVWLTLKRQAGANDSGCPAGDE
jgi:hypothetical protein